MADQDKQDAPPTDEEKQAIRDQAAQNNAVPQFPDELDRRAKEADEEAKQNE